MPKIDYNDFAELYLGRSPLGQSMPRYRRFDTAAKALRFAVEELRPYQTKQRPQRRRADRATP